MVGKPYHHGDLRSSLLGAAETILDRDGIGGLTLRAAAREAGVSHAAPSHHFGDLSGLLSALAASGFVRFREELLAECAVAGSGRVARVAALGRGYVGFARRHPGLFQLMFRSERLDWSSPGLQAAGEAAFGLLTQDEGGAVPGDAAEGFELLVVAMARWSVVHGLATLLLDGRLEKVTAAGVEVDAAIAEVIERMARAEGGSLFGNAPGTAF